MLYWRGVLGSNVVQDEWLVDVIVFGVFVVFIWCGVVHVWDALSFEGVFAQVCSGVLEYWWCQCLVGGWCKSSCEAFDCVVVVSVFAL